MPAVQPLVPGYLECVVPDANIKILLRLEAIDQIAAAAMEGFSAVRRRGLEVGGLLLGRVEEDCVIVEDSQAVESEHQRGPSWLLSEKDKQLLSTAISRVNDDPSGMRVVGLYRSQTRAGFAAAEEDVAQVREHSSGSRPVFLLVKPEAIGRGIALFAAGDGLQAISGVFPFRGGRASGSVRAPIKAPHGIGAALPPEPPAADSHRIGHAPRLSMARAIEGLAQDLDREPVSRNEPVIRDEPASRDELLNRDEPVSRDERAHRDELVNRNEPARRDELVNRDEPVRRDESVNRDELVNRNEPARRDASVNRNEPARRDELVNRDESVSRDEPENRHELASRDDRVNRHDAAGLFPRILLTVAILLCAGAGGYALARWWTALPRTEAGGTQTMALHAIWSGSNLHLQWNRNSPLIREANRGVLWIEDGAQRRHLDLKTEDLTQGSIQYWPSSSDVEFKLEVFKPDGSASESVRALSVPLAPVAAPPTPVPEPAPPPNEPSATTGAAHPSGRESAPKPFVTVAFEPLGGGKEGSPPMPLHRVMPFSSAGRRGRLKRDLTVDVRVEIDASGKVKRAELVSKHSDFRREFENLALGASRGWTFTPARNVDRRLPGQAVLHYYFGSSPPASAVSR